MSTPHTTPARDARLATLVALARLLERIEHSPQARDAGAYRMLVQRIQAVLAEDLPGEGRRAVLDAFPATAEIHENLHYAQAGLSRAPLDLSVATEMRAADLLARVSKAAPSPGS
jgi:hypothetical protein